jgi:hypothetical protein
LTGSGKSVDSSIETQELRPVGIPRRDCLVLAR